MTLARALTAATLALALASPAARADSNADAKEHFKKGQTHYALGEFTDAVTEFREAYRLRDEPAILFNIAQAMRQIGNVKQAYFYYSQYLSRRPEAPNRAEVEQFMALMKKKLDADEEADRMRKEAELSRPPPVHYPEDQLDDGENHGASMPDPAARAAVAEAAGKAKPEGPVAKGKPEGPAKGKPEGPAKGKPVEVAVVKARPTPPAAATGTTTSAVATAATALPPARTASTVPATALPATAPAESVAATPVPQADSGGHGLRYAGIAALGAGVGAGVLSFVFHSSAQSSADALSQKYQNGTLRPSDSSLKDDVASKGQLSTLAAISGAALIATGAALVFVF